MDHMPRPRRAVLRSIGATTIVSLAGCIGGDDGADDVVERADDTVIVGPDNNSVFDPEELEVEPGTTVAFVWESGGHSIEVTEQPDGAEWEGVAGLKSEEHVHEHTFDVEGRYEYQCSAHHIVDMRGTILVGDVA